MGVDFINMARKFLAMPSRDVMIRLGAELAPYLTRATAGDRESRLTKKAFLDSVKARSLEDVHHQIMTTSTPWAKASPSSEVLDEFAPSERARVLEEAQLVMDGCVNLLGAEAIRLTLGKVSEIDWYRDYKSGLDWPFLYFHDLDPSDLDRNSDVKYPWELSRLQWILPVAQAWQITCDNKYAAYVRSVLEHWMIQNPFAWGINWTCTMEPAMRVFTWSWLYTHLADAPSWRCDDFRFRFLRALYLHLVFVRRFIEITDVNGNHLTANATALVVGGILFGDGLPRRWMIEGWRLLTREINRQVYSDGMDFEGSTAYHRLVAELFHIAAAAVDGDGGLVPAVYRDRLLKMADYTENYTRPDGFAPIIGDNDDARVLHLGNQSSDDHRYLPALIRRKWAPDLLTDEWKENAAECLWWWGDAPTKTICQQLPKSTYFPNGGAYILRSRGDYVFFSCGPLGLAGRGGHSHNDTLSFEAVLDGCFLVSDSGCLGYTRDYRIRNKFRSTAFHNTPQVNGEEINRFISPRNLWFLEQDAQSQVRVWKDTSKLTQIIASHSGYQRLLQPTTVVRDLTLDKIRHALTWTDTLEPDEGQVLRVPLQLAPGVSVKNDGLRRLLLSCQSHRFELLWAACEGWCMTIESGTVAPHYDVAVAAPLLVWTRPANIIGGLTVTLRPLNR